MDHRSFGAGTTAPGIHSLKESDERLLPLLRMPAHIVDRDGPSRRPETDLAVFDVMFPRTPDEVLQVDKFPDEFVDWAELNSGLELDDFRLYSAKMRKQACEMAEQAAMSTILDRLVI